MIFVGVCSKFAKLFFNFLTPKTKNKLPQVNLNEYEEEPSEKGGSSTDTRGVIDSDEGFQDNKRLKKRALEKEVSKDGKTSKRRL